MILAPNCILALAMLNLLIRMSSYSRYKILALKGQVIRIIKNSFFPRKYISL